MSQPLTAAIAVCRAVTGIRYTSSAVPEGGNMPSGTSGTEDYFGGGAGRMNIQFVPNLSVSVPKRPKN
jgi:hypothetical protein